MAPRELDAIASGAANSKAMTPQQSERLISAPDNTRAPRMPPSGEYWTGVLAMLPAVHSCLWVIIIVLLPVMPDLGLHFTQSVIMSFITLWMVYGLLKFVTNALASFVGVLRCQVAGQRTHEEWAAMVPANAPIRFADVVHVVIVPNYAEPIETLARTLDTLQAQGSASQIVVVLAMEARDKKAHVTAEALLEKYGRFFKLMLYSVHKLQPGEVGGKSSNENWAMRCAKKRLVDEMGVDPDCVVVTTCDADTYFHPQHFSALSAAFATDANRYRRFWQGSTCFYPNIGDVPVLCSVRYTLLSVGFLGELTNPLAYSLPFAVYSISLRLAVEASFWDPAVIPEDWHMYLRCFYATKGKVTVQPLYLPVGCECVVDDSSWSSLTACYQQSKRWQWGAIDLGYIVVQNALKDAPLWRKMAVLFTAYEHHLLYNVMWIALFAAPYVFDSWGHWRFECWLAFLIWNWCGLIVLDGLYRVNLLKNRLHFKHSVEFISVQRALTLLMYPISDFFLFVIPTFHAHVRMALSTDFKYIVAPKVGAPAAQSAATPSTGAIELPPIVPAGERLPLLQSRQATGSYSTAATAAGTSPLVEVAAREAVDGPTRTIRFAV